MASEHRLIKFFEIFREGCFQGDFFFGIFSAGNGRKDPISETARSVKNKIQLPEMIVARAIMTRTIPLISLVLNMIYSSLTPP